MDSKGQIFSLMAGHGSTIRDKNRYELLVWIIMGIRTNNRYQRIYQRFDGPVSGPPRSVSKEELGELTYYGVCAAFHCFWHPRLIGPQPKIPSKQFTTIKPQYSRLYQVIPKNLREDYPGMPPRTIYRTEG